MRNFWKQFGIVLERKQKIKVGVLICMMVIGALLETVGVGLLPSIITVMMGTEDLLKNRYIGRACEILHLQTEQEILFFLLGGLIFLFIFYLCIICNTALFIIAAIRCKES